MVKAIVLVPIRDNDGKPFAHTDWNEMEQRLLRFGGMTQGADVSGAWIDGGKRYDDRSRQYISYLSSWTDLPAWLEIVRWAKEQFRQEAMAIEVAGIPDIIR